MHRLSGLVVVGALAVAVSVVAAGPALAAKVGNNDTARACQHGGWKTLVPAAGGAFANQGDCVIVGSWWSEHGERHHASAHYAQRRPPRRCDLHEIRATKAATRKSRG
jgi:hypothetical protein